MSVPDLVLAQTDSSAIELNIFPNPNNGTFYVTVIDDKTYPAQLFAMDGRVLKTMFLTTGLNYLSVEVPAGIYVLRVGQSEMYKDYRIAIK